VIRSYYCLADGDVEVFDNVADFDKMISKKESVLWVDLRDPTDEESFILTHDFKFHPLAIEDVMTEKTRTKLDDYNDYLFGVFSGC